MDEASERRRRLRRVLATVRPPAAEPRLLDSDSNDAWQIGQLVLRICWRGDRTRFDREALLAAHLPAGVPYPRIVDVGHGDGLAWQVTELVEGETLASAWPALRPAARESAIRQLGSTLAVLNGHRFDARVLAALGRPRHVVGGDLDDVIGADLNPLPVARALRLAGPARAVPFVDPRLIDRVQGRLAALAAVDPFSADARSTGEPSGVLHGDAHPGNVLWRDGRLVALLDLEWARTGPADLELQPFLEVDLDDDAAVGETRQLLSWLARSHPAAFAHPRLLDRLWLYQLAYALRHLLIRPPDRPEDRLPATHPVRRLRRLLDEPWQLPRLLGPHLASPSRLGP